MIVRDRLSSLGTIAVLFLVLVAIATPALGLAFIGPEVPMPNPAAILLVVSGGVMLLVHRLATRARR